MQFKKTATIVLAATMIVTSFSFNTVSASETAEAVDQVKQIENTESERTAETAQSDFGITHVILDDSNMLDENNQAIVVGYTGDTPEKAELNVKNTKTGENISINSCKISSSGLLFEVSSGLDDYELIDLSIYNNEIATKFDMKKMGFDKDKPDAYLDENEIQVENYSDLENYSNLARSSNGKYVVVLDPGHDDTHTGAAANGISEKDINLKIAKYCKQELESYYGVQVYMTRTTSTCPYPGTTSTDDNAKRVEYAKSVGADAYVSFHCDSSRNSGASGAKIFYPNANYNGNIGSQGAGLSQKILDNLTSLGLNNHGILIRNSEDNTLYPDGSLADYYGVIRRSKLNGFPGIIIEHAFVTNKSDASFMGNEDNLQKMGHADALGIAQYYGLSKTYFGIKSVDFSQENDYDRITVNADSNIGEPKYKVQAYDLDKKIWVTLASDSTDSTVTWKPEAKSYYIHVEITAPNGAVASYDSAFSSDIDYTKSYVKINGATWKINPHSIDLGVGYNHSGGDVLFKWQVYNLDTKKWTTLADRYSGNWITWRPTPGNYWVHVEAITQGGAQDQYTYCFNVGTDKSKTPMTLNGMTWSVKKTGIDVGTAYSSDDKNVKFKWQAYNLDKQEWSLVADWTGSNWVTWKPEQGNFWLYVEAMTPDGETKNTIMCFASQKDYAHHTLNLNGMCYNIYEDRIDVGIAYDSDDSNVSFKWEAYNLDTQQWNLVADWTGSNWVSWYPDKGNYWMHVTAKTSDGVTKDYTICFNAARNYNHKYISINGICSVNDKAAINLGVSYNTNDTSPAFRWQIYDLSTSTWSTLTDWTGSNWVSWYPGSGNYWVYLEAKTSDGTVENYCIAYQVTARYEIMGNTNTSLAQMVAYYNANNVYPEFYASSDAPSIEAFCQIYLEECQAEGLKAEVAFCQAMLETGFLRYGGDVQINQYNFAGLGATGNGAPGNSFGSVREGVRAQVQHLKAYASTAGLNNPCVDSRFQYVKRGTAPYVEWLGIQENPYGKGWATAKNYGYNIVNLYIAKLFRY